MVIVRRVIAKIIVNIIVALQWSWVSLAMRISDARFNRDMRRYQLAWRMIWHGVRNRTVQQWTGLSLYRVRALYEAYAVSGGSGPGQRGTPPYSVGYFWSSLQARSETAVLAGFLSLFEVIPTVRSATALASLAGVARGERLCRAYEEFKAIWPQAESTLEHAILLLEELVKAEEMEPAICIGCEALIVRDRLSNDPSCCAFCLHEAWGGRPYGQRRSRLEGEITREVFGAGTQGRLF